jgi:hypothetical protein
MTSVYYTASDELSSRGRPRSMDPIDELFMFLCRLKCGFLAEDLAVRFKMHKSSVSRKIITWTNYLYFLLYTFGQAEKKFLKTCHKTLEYCIQIQELL